MYIQPDFIIHTLAEKATADASLAGQQPYKTAPSGDLDWFGGAITKHCQRDDTDFKRLWQRCSPRTRRLPSTNTPGRVNALFAIAQHPTLGRPVHDEGEPLITLNPGPQPDAVVVFGVPSGSPLGLLEVHDAMFSSGANIDLSKANH